MKLNGMLDYRMEMGILSGTYAWTKIVGMTAVGT